MLLPGSGSSALRQAVELGWVPVGLTPTPAGPWQWQSVGPLQEAGSLSHDLSGTLSPHGQHLLGDLQTHIGALPSESGSCLNGAPHTPPPAKQGKTRAGIAACPMSLTLKLELIQLRGKTCPQFGQDWNQSVRVERISPLCFFRGGGLNLRPWPRS